MKKIIYLVLKVFEFIVGLFKEIDKEMVKLFKNLGSLRITAFGLLLLFIWYLASIFEYDNFFFFFSTLLVIFGVGLYIIHLNEIQPRNNSKIQIVINFIGSVFALIFAIFIISTFLWFIFVSLKDTYFWLVDLFS